MKASELMATPVITARTDMPVREAAALLAEHAITSLPVLDDDGNVVGMVSEVDLLRSRMPHDPRAHAIGLPDAAQPPERVGEVMSDVVVCLSENADSADLAEALVDNRIRAVPILRGAELVGIVSRRDLLRTLLRDDTAIAADVRERLAAYAGVPERWHIHAAEGIVTVTGAFASQREQETVHALASTVDGVVRVNLRPR